MEIVTKNKVSVHDAFFVSWALFRHDTVLFHGGLYIMLHRNNAIVISCDSMICKMITGIDNGIDCRQLNRKYISLV